MRIAADFEFFNVLICNANCRQILPAESNKNNFTDKLLANKPVAIGYNLVEKPI